MKTDSALSAYCHGNADFLTLSCYCDTLVETEEEEELRKLTFTTLTRYLILVILRPPYFDHKVPLHYVEI